MKIEIVVKKVMPRICFAFILIFVGLVLAQLLFPFTPQGVRQAKARRIKAFFDTREMASLLRQKAIEAGGVTNVNNYFVF